MAQERGETRETGWRHEQTIKTELSERRHDTTRTNEKGGRDFTEYKYGNRVGGQKTLLQIDKDRNVLERDPNATGAWVVKKGALDREVREKLGTLIRDFPNRFRVQEVSRADADRARRQGKALEARERSQQLELNVNVNALLRAQRVRDAARRTRDRDRTQEAARRAIDARNRMQRQRSERAKQREAQEKTERTVREVRAKAAREAAMRFPTLGEQLARHGDSQAAEKGARTEANASETARQREAEAAEKARKAREAGDAVAWQRQREAADRLAQTGREAREAAARGQLGDMAREAADMLRVTRPTPGAEPLTRDQIEATRTRGDRDELGREREKGPRTRH
ncbi:hypothetical protein [Nocardia thraciensis]